MSVQGGHTHFLHLGPAAQQLLLLEVTVLIFLVVFAFSCSDLLLVPHDCTLLRLENTQPQFCSGRMQNWSIKFINRNWKNQRADKNSPAPPLTWRTEEWGRETCPGEAVGSLQLQVRAEGGPAARWALFWSPGRCRPSSELARALDMMLLKAVEGWDTLLIQILSEDSTPRPLPGRAS